MVDSTSPVFAQAQTSELQVAARTLGLRLVVANASYQSDFDTAFPTIAREQAGAIVIGSDSVFRNNANQLVALAARYRVPAIYWNRAAAAAGGLMSYGPDTADQFRQLGMYTGRILKGEKPTDLPVVQATKLPLVLNMKTAKALGLTFPLTLLGRAHEVIE